MKLRLTRLQVILLVLGAVLVIASVFAPWFTIVRPDDSTEPLGGLEFITDAKYYLIYEESYGTIYSPLVPLVLVLAAVACEFFSVRYAPTLLSSLALGACIGDLVKLLRISCDFCGVSDIEVAPGIILSMAGCVAVVVASFLEGKPVEAMTEEGKETPPAEEKADTGEDEADAWFEDKD